MVLIKYFWYFIHFISALYLYLLVSNLQKPLYLCVFADFFMLITPKAKFFKNLQKGL